MGCNSSTTTATADSESPKENPEHGDGEHHNAEGDAEGTTPGDHHESGGD
jgi:hypothetical protein